MSMIKDYNQILPGLEQDIIKQIKVLENRRLFFKKGTFGFISLSTLIIVSVLTYSIVGIVSSSGAIDYISLFFSDISMITYWKEITLSITETFPFMEFSLFLCLVGLFVWSLSKAVNIPKYEPVY